MRFIQFLLSFLLLFISVTSITAAQDAQINEQSNVTLHLFHSKSCPHCQEERVFLSKLQSRYPDLTIKEYELSKPENIQLFQTLGSVTHISTSAVPMTIVGSIYIR